MSSSRKRRAVGATDPMLASGGTGHKHLGGDDDSKDEQHAPAVVTAVTEEQVLGFIRSSAAPVAERLRVECERRCKELKFASHDAAIQAKHGAELAALGMTVHVVDKSYECADYHVFASVSVKVTLARRCNLPKAEKQSPHEHVVERTYNGDDEGEGTTFIGLDGKEMGQAGDDFVQECDPARRCFTTEEAAVLDDLLLEIA